MRASSLGPARELPWFQDSAAVPPAGLGVEQRQVMSLLLNMLSRLVITFLPRSKRLLISWLQSPSAVIWEPKKIKSDTVSTVSPSIYFPWSDGTGCHDLRFLNVEL